MEVFWVVVIIIIAVVASVEGMGQVALIAGVIGLGLWLLSWITGLSIFLTLGKICLAIIVVVIVACFVIAIVIELEKQQVKWHRKKKNPEGFFGEIASAMPKNVQWDSAQASKAEGK